MQGTLFPGDYDKGVIKNVKKKTTKKWHRVNFFMKEKKSTPGMKKNPEEHPALIFGQSKTHYKAIHFTSHPTTHGEKNVELEYNVDPTENKRRSYAVPYKQPRPRKEYQAPDKEYRIHKKDLPKINALKHKK